MPRGGLASTHLSGHGPARPEDSDRLAPWRHG